MSSLFWSRNQQFLIVLIPMQQSALQSPWYSLPFKQSCHLNLQISVICKFLNPLVCYISVIFSDNINNITNYMIFIKHNKIQTAILYPSVCMQIIFPEYCELSNFFKSHGRINFLPLGIHSFDRITNIHKDITNHCNSYSVWGSIFRPPF